MNSTKKLRISCNINGDKKTFEVYPMTRLLDVLRLEAGLTGTKEGCSEGECGACAVIIDNEIVNACLVPVIQVEGAEIFTVEGLAQGRSLSKIQESFLEKGGAQCGFCTPGMLMATRDLLTKNPEASMAEIRQGLAGNLCRCTGYKKILESIDNVIHEGKE
jgi:aerobic-type carbon monoxide dehydrogenase small subunit (CoxS/CutS family)